MVRQFFLQRLLFAVFAVSIFSQTNIAQAGLIGHWTFDESPAANGATIADSSGATVHDGTLTTNLGNASVAGMIGGALDFDNSASFVQADLDTDFVFGNDPATIAFWMNPDDMNSQNFLFAWGTNSGGQNVRISMENKGGVGIVFRTRHQAGFVEFDASAMTLASGWHHVALVVPDTASTVGDVLIYMDGVSLTELQNDTDALNVQATGGHGTNLFIGTNYNAGTGYNGQLDDVGWWNEALSEDDISDIYEGGLVGKDLQESLQQIPEPSSIALTLLGLVGLVGFAIRRKK